MTTREMRHSVLQMARQSYQEGLFAGTSGNLSLRDMESGLFAITPSSLSYTEMMPSDIVVLDLEGNVVEGKRPPSSEWRMHAGIYRERDDLHAIVHTHSPEATAFAAARRPIPVVLIEMMFFLCGEVHVADYRAPGSWELAETVLQALRGRTACLMANHGVVAVGDTLEQAHIRAVYVEDAAKICARAETLGGAVEIPLEQQNEIRRKMGIPQE